MEKFEKNVFKIYIFCVFKIMIVNDILRFSTKLEFRITL